MNMPDKRRVRTVELFLPNLFTNQAEAKLPRAYKVAPISNIIEA